MKGILEADSPRVSDIGRAMGLHSPEANCRGVYRFLQKTDPREALRLMYRENAEYIMGGGDGDEAAAGLADGVRGVFEGW